MFIDFGTRSSYTCNCVCNDAYLVLKLRGELLGLGYDVPDAVADVAADALETGAEPVGRPRSQTPLLQL